MEKGGSGAAPGIPVGSLLRFKVGHEKPFFVLGGVRIVEDEVRVRA
jgi:hypothetical protein